MYVYMYKFIYIPLSIYYLIKMQCIFVLNYTCRLKLILKKFYIQIKYIAIILSLYSYRATVYTYKYTTMFKIEKRHQTYH